VGILQHMYCRRCEQMLLTDSRDRCDACGSTEVVPAASPEGELARLVALKKAGPLPPGPDPGSGRTGGHPAGLFGMISELMEVATTAPATGDLGEGEARRHAKYHYRIVIGACVFAALGAILGVAGMVGVFTLAKPGTDGHHGRIGGLLLAPFTFSVAGFVFGMAMMCLIAPTDFLNGPVGRPWMDKIGTRSPAVARVACAIFGLMVTAPLVALGIFIAMN
jgi:hypothetical protein